MENLKNKLTKTVIGLMSGTSQDGIDTALLKIKNSGKSTSFELIDFDTYEYPKEVKEKLQEITTEDAVKLKDITRLNFAIGKCFADSAKKICEKANIKINRVDLIGSHGQTVTHLPEETNFCGKNIKSTMQIGEPSVIAKETGVVTVADFRPCDIALGGEGAPLTGYTDYILFSSKTKNRAIVNIGGITNITTLPKNCSLEEIKAFDIGPGNMCINEAMKVLYGKEYDKDGLTAMSGNINQNMLKRMLDNVFFKNVLKSTGRLHFGADFVEENIEQSSEEDVKNEDIIATFTEFSAYLISKNIEKLDVDEVILCGGGYKNPVLRNRILKNSKNVIFKDINEFGMSVDNREAIAFAVLANETVSGIPSNLGFKKGVLGKIILP